MERRRGCVVATETHHSDLGLRPAPAAAFLDLPLHCTNTHIPAGSSQPRQHSQRADAGFIPARCRPFSPGTFPHHKKRERSPGLLSASEIGCLTVLDAYGTHLPLQIGGLNPTPFRSAKGNNRHCPSLLNGIHLSLRTKPSMFNCSSYGTLATSTLGSSF